MMGKSLLAAMPHSRNKPSLLRVAGYTVLFALPVCFTMIETALADTTCHPLEIPTMATEQGHGGNNWSFFLPNGQEGINMGLETFGLGVGTYDLGTSDNLQYSTCNPCTKMYIGTNPQNPEKYFFQDRGSLRLTNLPAPTMPVEFNNLRLIEVTYDENYENTPVPGGECYEGPILDTSFEN